jgi:hypothetical protein
MSGQDAPSHEMPKFARQARLSREHEGLALDMLLDGMPLPPEAPPEMSALPSMLADLSGPAGPSELAGEAAALSRFRRRHSPAGISSRRKPERRMPPWQSPARRAQLAAALTVAAIGLGSTAAAYADVLPSQVQQLAHEYIGAPSAGPAPRHPGKVLGRAHHHAPRPGAAGVTAPAVPAGHENPAPGQDGPVRSRWPGVHRGGLPGRYGTPPGQRGTPPGQRGTPPGQRGTQPGQQGTQPGQQGTQPWQQGTQPWQRGTPPGQQDTTHGRHGTPPGQQGTTHQGHTGYPEPSAHPGQPAHPQPPPRSTAHGGGFQSHGRGGHGHGAHGPPAPAR